ncbi:hypothetical protein DFH08DRAFT_943907 [Mycena albidolilacea]|uniref:Uncharacterized protein n=1 Tax=Mycena albidolilacea TaxID=1033008 RepID=A0AAD6Z881_9AGAR|nr:hypothetical protein DFH08DRAFT_943907 [Mycena albidolilacea]
MPAHIPGPPTDPLDAPVPTVDNAVPTTRRRTISGSDSESLSVKRGRGRPRGSGTRTKPASRPKSKAKPQKDKENHPPTIELDDSDADIEKTADGKPRHWKADERTPFYEFLLEPTEAGDKRFAQHKTYPGHVYKRAAELVFKGRRSADSIKSMYGRSLETFTWMRAFESFTGNGGGDADCDDPEAILKKKLVAARKSGLVLGSLKPATITEWEENGWWTLFNDRLGTSAKVSRPVIRNSASAISDIDESGNDSDNSDSNIHPDLRARAPPVPKTPAATVSEPKHTPASNLRKQAGLSFGNLGDFVKMKMVSEEKNTMLEARLKLDREKLELEITKGKVDMASTVLGIPGADENVKVAANAYLLSLFTS